MDLFFTLLLTVFRTYRGPRDANVWDGTRYRFRPRFWDRMRNGQLYPSRIPSFIDISLINFFIGTRMSAVVRKHGWIPVVLSSVQTRPQSNIPDGELEIHTRVVGWEDQYVEIEHTWYDDTGREVLNSIYLTRVTHAGRNKVTGADMLRELGEAYTEKPLSPAASGLLAEYLRVKDANQALSLA
jgi:hypothetical protein